MRDIINATIGENHFLKCSTYSIARNGEGLTPCLSISIPDGLKSFWAYIDFKKPNGEKVKTPRIDVTEGKIVYNIQSAVLDAEGELEVQVIFQNENGEIWKTYVKEFAVRYSINATDDIPNKEDFITEAQKLVNEAVEVAKNVEERANNGEFDGKDGENGISPSIDVTETERGHNLKITDANGTQTVSVLNGMDGKDAVVDQTFDPKSENAQSGKAVAEAVIEKWELLHDIVVETEVNALNLDVHSKKVHLEAVLKKPANYTSGSVSIYLQPGSYRGAMMAAAYQSSTGLMAVQGDMHIEPSGRITTMLGVEQGEYGYSSAHRRSIVTKNFATNGKIPTVQLQATAFGVGSIIKVWGVK